jgi:hypothetical protein
MHPRPSGGTRIPLPTRRHLRVPANRRQAQTAQRQKVAKWLALDPRFQVRTIDGIGWVDPFTGAILVAPDDFAEVAKRHLIKNRPWLRFALKSMDEIMVVAWAHHLQGLIATESRLRIFRRDGSWLNPYDGTWSTAVAPERGRVTLATVEKMAAVLSRCPAARGGALLGRAALKAVVEGSRTDSERRMMEPPKPKTAPHPRRHGRPPLVRAMGGAAPPGGAIELPETELEMFQAKLVIENLLPQVPPIPGYDMVVHYEPHSIIGGDFFEIIRLDHQKYFIAIGDVSGHGTGAALVVASALKSLRLAVKQGADLVTTVCSFNDDFHADSMGSYFITLFAAEFDISSSTLTSVCAGHHAALLGSLRRRATIQQLGDLGPAVGLMKGEMFRQRLEPFTIQVRPGDVFLQFTDGLFEVFNRRKEQLGLQAVMSRFLAHLHRPCAEIVANLVKEAQAFAGGPLSDDLAVMAFKFLD